MRMSVDKRTTEAAFTLLEAVVSLMVLSIVVAIAIPAFRGFHRSAADGAAQEEINAVLAAEQAHWAARGSHTDDPAAVIALQPAARPASDDPSAGVAITLNPGAGAVCLERASSAGTTFGIWESATAGTFYGRGGGLTGACPDEPPAGYGQGGW